MLLHQSEAGVEFAIIEIFRGLLNVLKKGLYHCKAQLQSRIDAKLMPGYPSRT
jgi:hypothetical protein